MDCLNNIKKGSNQSFVLAAMMAVDVDGVDGSGYDVARRGICY